MILSELDAASSSLLSIFPTCHCLSVVYCYCCCFCRLCTSVAWSWIPPLLLYMWFLPFYSHQGIVSGVSSYPNCQYRLWLHPNVQSRGPSCISSSQGRSSGFSADFQTVFLRSGFQWTYHDSLRSRRHVADLLWMCETLLSWKVTWIVWARNIQI